MRYAFIFVYGLLGGGNELIEVYGQENKFKNTFIYIYIIYIYYIYIHIYI
jgi:hypothetical protein